MNQVFFIGRVGQDPEMKTFGTINVTNYSIAITEKHTSKQGEKVERTMWLNVAQFGNGAQFAKNYIRKGQKILVDGKIEVREYLDKNEIKRKDIHVIAENVTILADPNKPASQPANNLSSNHNVDDEHAIPF